MVLQERVNQMVEQEWVDHLEWMSRLVGLQFKYSQKIPAASPYSLGCLILPGIPMLFGFPDVISSIPPCQYSIVCCVTDPELPFDLSQQPKESPRVLMGSAARWQEDSKMRKDRSGDIPIKPSQAWPKIMSSVMDIQQGNLPLSQDYRPFQNDPVFFILGAPSNYVPGFQARQMDHIRERKTEDSTEYWVHYVVLLVAKFIVNHTYLFAGNDLTSQYYSDIFGYHSCFLFVDIWSQRVCKCLS